MNEQQKSFNKLFSKKIIFVLAFLAVMPVTPLILCLIYGWSN